VAALWFLLALAVGGLFAHAAIPGITPASDLWDHSQTARQIARGEGFTSLYTYPLFLGHEDSPFPVRWRMPLYAVLGALLLKLGIALPAGFLYLAGAARALLVALTYRLGAKLHRVASRPSVRHTQDFGKELRLKLIWFHRTPDNEYKPKTCRSAPA
jgi:hypothetical protein